MDTETFVPDAQISDVLLGYLSELPHNHNLDTETLYPDAQISDVLPYDILLSHNHNLDTETLYPDPNYLSL